MEAKGPWLYKAEGNQHIVLSSAKDLEVLSKTLIISRNVKQFNNQIIRLKKAFVSPFTTEYCLAYSETLISSLLSPHYYSPCVSTDSFYILVYQLIIPQIRF